MFWQRLSALEPSSNTRAAARVAGRAVFLVSGGIAAIVLVIVALRVRSGAPLLPLSLIMPALGLLWTVWLGYRSWTYRPLPAQASAAERSSRPPPRWEPEPTSSLQRPSEPDHRISA